METYNDKSCNTLEKLFYRPIEAALRWCNLIAHESDILATVGESVLPPTGAFPRWPCLRLNTEKIHDAILNKELPYGRDGKTVVPGETVRKDRITVRHADLRVWMAACYPDQKPVFLFDEIERNSHSAINAESFRALQADRDALKSRVEKATEVYKALKHERDQVVSERDLLLVKNKDIDPLDPRERVTLLVIVAALAKEAKINLDAPGKAAIFIESLTDSLGVHVSKRAIEEHLKRISDALETRMK